MCGLSKLVGLEHAQDVWTPSPGCLHPSSLQLGNNMWFQAQRVSVDPFARHLVGITYIEAAYFAEDEVFHSREGLQWVRHCGSSHWDHLVRQVWRFRTTLPSPCLGAVLLYGLCTQCCCCLLDLECLAWGGAREEEAQWCGGGACNALHALRGWLYALLVKRGQGNTVE